MKNLVTIILAAMVVAGCLFVESNEFVALAFIGIVGGVVAVKDYRKQKPMKRQNRSRTI